MSGARLLNLSGKLSLQRPLKFNATIQAARCMADWVPQDPITHTGQHWDKDDYRLVRFIEKPKQVNTNFAIKLIDEMPPKASKDRVVWCDGGGGPVGHPKVYINLDKPGNHICGYCGLRFYLEKGQH